MSVPTSPELPIGDLRIDDHLPGAFTDEQIRHETAVSRDMFVAANGSLPIKLRIEDFCFQRADQLCTMDSPRKYLAWAASDDVLTNDILGSLTAEELPVVLRSHPLEFGMVSPTVQVTSLEQLVGQDSDLARFMGGLDRPRTIVELLKNPMAQAGLLLCRPTFIYDEAMRQRVQLARDEGPQVAARLHVGKGLPSSFAGIRVLALTDFAREKKQRSGTWFAYDHETGDLVAQIGMPLEAKWQMEGEFSARAGGILVGRTLNQRNGQTTLHYASPERASVTPNSTFISQADVQLLGGVLAWQLPRLVAFENEIREQDWIPQGLSSTHQFIVVPPESIDGSQINTQYYDFHPHQSEDELRQLAADQGRDFDALSPEELLRMFY